MICNRCNREAPTRTTKFYQHYGLIIIGLTQSFGGDMCKSCALKMFFKCTAITMVAGWWGIISFFVNLFVIAYNTIEFFSCLVMAPVPPGATVPQLTNKTIEILQPRAKEVLHYLNSDYDINWIAGKLSHQTGVPAGEARLFVEYVVIMHVQATVAEAEAVSSGRLPPRIR